MATTTTTPAWLNPASQAAIRGPMGGMYQNGGMVYQPTYTSLNDSGEGGGMMNQQHSGYNVYKQGHKIGDSYDMYDMTGKKTGSGVFKEQNAWQLALMAAAAAGGMALLPAAGAAAGGSVVGGATGAGTATGLGAGTAAGATAAGAGAGGAGGTLGTISTIGKGLSLAGTVANAVGGKGGGSGGGSGGGGTPNTNTNGGTNWLNLLGGTGGLADVMKLLAGANDAKRQGEAAKEMKNWLNGGLDQIEKLYSPNSPESNYLWQEMSRKDAAAGRNSQYGPRTADFAGRVANEKANVLTRYMTGTSRAYADALNQNAGKYAGVGGAAGDIFSGANTNGLAQTVQQLINGGKTVQQVTELLGGINWDDGAFLGEGVPSGIDAWDQAFNNAGGTWNGTYDDWWL